MDLNVDSDKLIANTEKTDVIASAWMRISSVQFKNSMIYPELTLPNYTTRGIPLDDSSTFRLNEKFKDDQDFYKRLNFYFQMSNKNLYYSADKNDLNVLGSVPIKRLVDVLTYPITNLEEATCMKLVDKENIVDWKICANDLKTINTWVCNIKNLIGILDPECAKDLKDNTMPTILEKKITQPIVLIPQPAKMCNEEWDFQKKGLDWECDCIEGKEQSPIDLPHGAAAIQTPVKPIFQYEKVGPSHIVKNSEGEAKEAPLKFEYKNGMLQIENSDTFGKVITLDGSIYNAVKIVFHTPAEHTLDGKKHDMEMQVIHQGVTKGDIAKQVVLSFIFAKRPGSYNKFIDDLDFFNLPTATSTVKDLTKAIYIPKVFYESSSDDISIMRPFSFFTYQGSLTFPPCSERTINYVASEPIFLSTTALTLFKEALRIPDFKDSQGNIIASARKNENDRKIQPLNGRTVFFYDHVKYCGPDPPKVNNQNRYGGHYEKIKNRLTQYFFVNGERPSGLPNSFVVSEAEAKGLKEENLLKGYK